MPWTKYRIFAVLKHYTSTEFNAYKSLNAYQLYENGWEQYMAGYKMAIGFIVFGKVVSLLYFKNFILKYLTFYIGSSFPITQCPTFEGMDSN